MIEKLPLLFWPREQTLTTLIFHRVLPAPDPLRRGEPDAERFDALMRFVADNFSVLPLPEAVDRLQSGSLPHRACCITFDDGYADNLTIAVPILEKYRLPATVFIATGYLDGGRMFNDAVIDAIAATTKPELDLGSIGLGVHPIHSLEQKQAAIDAILSRIKLSTPELRDQQVKTILEASGCSDLPHDIMLTSQQVREMSDRGIEIGGHTNAHTILSTLDEKRAYGEIVTGKHLLEAIIGNSLTSFAYPNGKPGRDYTERHISLVKTAGFKRAVTTGYGVARKGSDVFQLPRFTPWAANGFRRMAQLVRNAWIPANV
ncbi:MAG: polysaccharide deacetylase family protein [Rhodocyclaceae bacterium]|nr:polysaccharide deacetylase family protein [Rhodocyclaceae bacterium]